MRQPLPKIPDLEILEEIGHGGYSRLYRARRDGKDYVVKVLKEDRELDLASRFLREGTALARFSHPGLVSILEVGKDDGRPYLVMEYVDGETLAAHLSRGRVSEDMLRAWAKALASALSEVHRLGLVHRDIKPENILIDRSLSPKLIDFGFVAEATRTDADEVVGSFRYSAPEQTGMLKRAVDGRSDLYSLGVVLFECATGAPPFASENVGELLRQHAAIQAPTVISQRPDFSRAFSAVIAKLLAKDPDDRYRSAASLLHDLDNLHGLDLAKLDSHEVSSSAVEPSLVGREDELGRLVDYQARARNGQGVAVCISGEAGLGKTRLANELVKGVADERVFVLRGKCSQKNPVPFAPLRRAVEELLLTVSRLPETERAARLDVLRRAAGDGAGLLRHLAPGLFSLFADARETVPIDGEESQFHGAVADFILRLAGDGRSVILLVDDVQWVDGATLRILKNIRRRLAGGSFLMLVTARTDAESGFSLATINEELTISPETQVKLKALGESAVARMIVELLGGHEIESSFASQIAFRCKGNPFAVGEYLRALLDEGYLRYSWGRWILDAHQLGLIQLPGDVIHLVVKRVNGLDAETSKILCAAAVQGMRLQPKLLPEIAGATSAGVGFAIGEGYRAGLVTSENDGYAFVHERIRDAFAARLSPAELAELHQTIAEVTDHAGASGEEALYSLADHYAKGTPDKNPRRVYEVNLEAGTRAAGHYANQEAFDFLVQAYKASLRCAVPSSPMLFSALGDLCFRLDHVDTGISFLTRALDLTSDGGERAAIHTKLATGHLSRLDIRKAREAVFAGLADLGARYPRTIVGRLLSLGVWIVKACFARRVSAEGRPRLEALLALYTAGQLAAFHEFDSLTFVELILRSFYPARRLGRSPQLASCYAYFGMLLSFAKMKSFGRRYLDRSAAMAESLGDPRVLAEARLLGAYGVDGEGDPAKALPLLRDALKNHGRWLSHHHYMEASFAGIVGLMARGYVNEAWGWLEGVLQKVEENFIPDRMGLLLYPAYRAAMLARLGRMTQATECMNEARAMAKALPDNRFSWAFYLTQF